MTAGGGLEFVSWRELDAGLGAKAPWSEPTVENTNGRLRRHLPRDTGLLSVPDRVVRAIQDRLNATPRKCLGWRTPAGAFRDHLMAPHPPA